MKQRTRIAVWYVAVPTLTLLLGLWIGGTFHSGPQTPQIRARIAVAPIAAAQPVTVQVPTRIPAQSPTALSATATRPPPNTPTPAPPTATRPPTATPPGPAS